MIENIIYNISVWTLPVLIAITLHEAAHGYVADWLGDDTARRAGRLSLNPLAHVDLFGTILLPVLLFLSQVGFLFGYAKPVPVDFRRLRNPRRDMALVAAAGPAINLMLAIAAAILYYGVEYLPDGVADWAADNLGNALQLNVFLAVLNMIPLPPLDGGRVAVGLLPDALAMPLARLERYGFLILIAAVFLLPKLGQMLGVDLDVFRWIVGAPSYAIVHAIASFTGLI